MPGATQQMREHAKFLGREHNQLAATRDTPRTHIHLQVGNVPDAEAFYRDQLGFPVMAHYPGAAFYGSGGYHHHIATNIWNSRGAGPRSYGTGLSGFTILADTLPAETCVTDPWGIEIEFTGKN